MKSKIFIFGASSFAEIASAYFSNGDQYEVLGHIVDAGFAQSKVLEDLPVFETGTSEADKIIRSCSHFYVAATYTNLNRLRTNKLAEFKSAGLSPASYVSPNAFIDPSVSIGEHSFIFENNVIQFETSVGTNCILWSGNHIGHHSTIGDNVFISSHVVISGHCTIGANSFLGVNSTVYNNVDIGSDNWISPNSIVAKSTEDNIMMRPQNTPVLETSTRDFFRVDVK